MIEPEPLFDAALMAAKLLDAERCLLPVELAPDEADAVGAFSEDALSPDEALESRSDDLAPELIP
jgi:hypothetical protein